MDRNGPSSIAMPELHVASRHAQKGGGGATQGRSRGPCRSYSRLGVLNQGFVGKSTENHGFYRRITRKPWILTWILLPCILVGFLQECPI